MKQISIWLIVILGSCCVTKKIIAQTNIDITDSGSKVKISRHIYGHFAEQPEKIKSVIFKDAVIDKKSLAVTLPAASVVVLAIK